MKIGIITYWQSQDNYGQLLQCYALQAYLRAQGHEPFLMRYLPKQNGDFRLSKLSPDHIFNWLRLKLWHSKGQSVLHDFSKFRQKITQSDKIYRGFKELCSENWDGVDAFVCGSDQIWSPKSHDELQAYFLQFAPYQSKVIAYAPSFGRDSLPDDYQSELKRLLCRFDAISVRENSGIDICAQAGKEASLVCDPTLLLSKEHYAKEFALQKHKRENCFLYFINWDTDIEEAEIVKFLNVNKFGSTLFATIGYKSTIPLHKQQTPQAWVTQLYNAEFSIVNSFHGLVFSLIFHVPFAVCLLKGDIAAMNGRVLSILEKVGLQDRIVSSSNTLQDIKNRDVDWQNVDGILRSFREQSKNFLSESLDPSAIASRILNICFITNGSVNHRFGGLDRVTEILANKFESDGHTVYYLSFKDRGYKDEKRQHLFPKSEIHHPDNADFLGKFVNSHNIYVVINQEGNVNLCIPKPANTQTAWITCLHFAPNYIQDEHFHRRIANLNPIVKYFLKGCLFFPGVNSYLLSILRRKLGRNYRNNLEWCDRFVLLSSRFKKELITLTGDITDLYKLESIHNPLPPANERETNFPKENIILYVGRLDIAFKRLDRLVKNVAKVLTSHPDWKMVICGTGPDEDVLKRMAAKLSDRIEFVGYCDPNDWYRKASVITLFSGKSEGWGMVLTEAMRYGVVPVVSGTYASLPDIIDNGVDGVITSDEDEDFISALSKVLADDKIKCMSKAAIAKAHGFDIETIARLWYKLFDKCCSR